MREVQILYLIGITIGIPVTEWWALAVAYVLIQFTELHGLMLVRRIFYAARDPSDDLSRFAGPAMWYEWVSALAIAAGIAVGMLNTVPEWHLGAIALWCLATMYFVFPTVYCAWALYGCILIQSVAMIATSLVAHEFCGTPEHLTLANVSLGIFAGAAAAFVGRQLRGSYLAQLERERELCASVKALDRINAMKTEFLGRLSHEMRTPMNGIMGLTALLQRTALTDEQRRQLELLRTSGQHLVALLDDSLDLSQLETRAIKLSAAPIDLAELVEEQVRLYSQPAREKGLALTLEFGSEIPSLMVLDATRVRQCLGNLIGNAIKFSDRGEISIGLTVDEDALPATVVITVSDRGIGVPPQLSEAIFDPYAQARTGATRLLQGVGLGLAITRRLARLMGGDVTYAPREDGGSVFRLRFTGLVEQAAVPRQADLPAVAGG